VPGASDSRVSPSDYASLSPSITKKCASYRVAASDICDMFPDFSSIDEGEPQVVDGKIAYFDRSSYPCKCAAGIISVVQLLQEVKSQGCFQTMVFALRVSTPV